jgi:hypothetical protein
MGFGLVNGFIDHLYTCLISTSNYSVIADLHIFQITRAHTKSSQSTFTSCFLVKDHNNGDSSVYVLVSLPAGKYSTIELSTELIAPTVLVITSQHGPQ